MKRRELTQLLVIGAGTMGHGIAQVAATAGYVVALADSTEELANAGLARIAENLAEAVRRARLDPAAPAGILDRVRSVSNVAAAAAQAAFVIEAVPERMALKRAVFAELDTVAPTDALLASNTSSLSITELQRGTRSPGRVIGLHFFNPVPSNPLVEVVRGADTNAATVARALELVRTLGKQSVLVKDSPGFATSRLGVLLGLEAMRMLEEGVASAADIDRAMELGYRHPMGPLRVSDLVGLDVRLAIARELHAQLGGERFRPPRILERLVTDGKLGRKTGQGFYEWPARAEPAAPAATQPAPTAPAATPAPPPPARPPV